MRVHAKHLQDKLKDWLDWDNLIAEEQAGFKEGRGTIDQCLVLQHLIEKIRDQQSDITICCLYRPKGSF